MTGRNRCVAGKICCSKTFQRHGAAVGPSRRSRPSCARNSARRWPRSSAILDIIDRGCARGSRLEPLHRRPRTDARRQRAAGRNGQVGSIQRFVGRTTGSDETRMRCTGLRHDLRTPLNAIKGYGELLIEEADATARIRCVADLAKLHDSPSVLGQIDAGRAGAAARRRRAGRRRPRQRARRRREWCCKGGAEPPRGGIARSAHSSRSSSSTTMPPTANAVDAGWRARGIPRDTAETGARALDLSPPGHSTSSCWI